MILYKLDFNLQNKIKHSLQKLTVSSDEEINEEMKIFYGELSRHISEKEIERIARETKYVQRKSKLSAWKSLWLCAFSNIDAANDTLVRLASKVSNNNGPILSCQAIDQRLNSKCVDFLRSLFNQLFKIKFSGKNVNIPTEFDHLFKRIRILDSTAFQLPEEYEDTYPGSGGCAQASGGKIQLEFELKSGEILNVDFGAGSDSDNTYGSKIKDTIEQNDLILRDLGYFSFDEFNDINTRKAFYISRLKPNIAVYVDNDDVKYYKNGKIKKTTLHKRIDLVKIMHAMDFGEMLEIEGVSIGRIKKLPSRIILYKLTEKQLKERKEQADYVAKKKGVIKSEKTIALLGITMYISNIPKEMLDKHKVYELYTLRWQVEILFKTWKSTFSIHKVKKVKIERFQCHIYGKLILVVLASTVMFRIRTILLNKESKEGSEIKISQIVHEYISSLYLSCVGINSEKEKVLLNIYMNARKNARKSHRKGKKTYFDILGVHKTNILRQSNVVA